MTPKNFSIMYQPKYLATKSWALILGCDYFLDNRSNSRVEKSLAGAYEHLQDPGSQTS